MNEVVLAHPVWTAIGIYGGSLKSVPAVDVHGRIRDQCRSCASVSLRDDWGGSTPLSRLMMRLSSERLFPRGQYRQLLPDYRSTPTLDGHYVGKKGFIF